MRGCYRVWSGVHFHACTCGMTHCTWITVSTSLTSVAHNNPTQPLTTNAIFQCILLVSVEEHEYANYFSKLFEFDEFNVHVCSDKQFDDDYGACVRCAYEHRIQFVHFIWKRTTFTARSNSNTNSNMNTNENATNENEIVILRTRQRECAAVPVSSWNKTLSNLRFLLHDCGAVHPVERSFRDTDTDWCGARCGIDVDVLRMIGCDNSCVDINK